MCDSRGIKEQPLEEHAQAEHGPQEQPLKEHALQEQPLEEQPLKENRDPTVVGNPLTSRNPGGIRPRKRLLLTPRMSTGRAGR